MCCFLVPLAQAVATTVYRKVRNSGEKVRTLEKMLWGGSIMLIVDHIINGELTWQYPFFTALTDAGGGSVFLRELLTVGVPMSLAITAIWGIWALISERRTAKA
ncbi:MAG: hypothetical protein ACI3ZI_04170 [Candidatus Cryptobacteroides sp.]